MALLKKAGSILRSKGGAGGRAFWAKAYNNGSGSLNVAAVADGFSVLPKGWMQFHIVINRTSGKDQTQDNIIETIVRWKGETLLHYTDSISSLTPEGANVSIDHAELIQVTQDRDLSDFTLDVEEIGEKSEEIYAEIQVHSVESVGNAPEGGDKVAVDAGKVAGYLSEVVEVESPMSATINGNKLHINWDGTSNNTLTLISNMSLANAIKATNATDGTTSPTQKYGMTLSAFVLPNYFNLSQSDVFGIITTNVVQDVTLFKVAIYKLDFDLNAINLVAISKDYSELIKNVHGYIEVEVDTIYREKMDSYGIYYIGIMTDQPSVLVAAGQDATLFNNTMPLMGIKFHNVAIGTQIDKVDLSTGKINDTEEQVSFQESTSRICCIYRHILDEGGDPIVPSPDDPIDPPTPEDPSAIYEKSVNGSIYWLQTSCYKYAITLYEANGTIAEVNVNDEDWSSTTGVGINNTEYTTEADGSHKLKFGLTRNGDVVTGKITNNGNGNSVEFNLTISDGKYVEPSKVVVSVKDVNETNLLKDINSVSVGEGGIYSIHIEDDGIHIALDEESESLDDILSQDVGITFNKKYEGKLVIAAKSISTAKTTSTNNVFALSYDRVSFTDIKQTDGKLIEGNDSGSITTSVAEGEFTMPNTDRIWFKLLWSNTSSAKIRHKELVISKLEVM